MNVVLKCVLVFVCIVIALGLLLGFDCLVALLICLIASGFGFNWPFWPVVGALFLFQLFLAPKPSSKG